MTSQQDKAALFKDLHAPGAPLILYNIWDAGSAKALASAGAPAIATGSDSVAAAHGYEDGEQIPLELVETIAGRICASVDAPVSIDFEGGYARGGAALAANVTRIIKAGAIGINFEDQVVDGDALYAIDEQSARIKTIREAALAAGVDLFINARTDLFLKESDKSRHANLVDEALARAEAYAAAGASGIFAPLLTAAPLIEKFCAAAPLPVNIMQLDGGPDRQELAGLGVARISHGPFPYRKAMAELKAAYQAAV